MKDSYECGKCGKEVKQGSYVIGAFSYCFKCFEECENECQPKNRKEKEIIKPTIEIDRKALRFNFSDGGGTNLFWDDLFSPRFNSNFQQNIMLHLKKMYDECVLQNIKPNMTDERE